MAGTDDGAELLGRFAAFMKAEQDAKSADDDFAVDLETIVDGRTVKIGGVPYSKIGADVRKALGLTGGKPEETSGDGGSESAAGGDGKAPAQLRDYFKGGRGKTAGTGQA